MDSAVCLWLFRRDAHVDNAGLCDDGVVPAEVLVCVLPDGYDDAGHMPVEKWKEGES